MPKTSLVIVSLALALSSPVSLRAASPWVCPAGQQGHRVKQTQYCCPTGHSTARWQGGRVYCWYYGEASKGRACLAGHKLHTAHGKSICCPTGLKVSLVQNERYYCWNWSKKAAKKASTPKANSQLTVAQVSKLTKADYKTLPLCLGFSGSGGTGFVLAHRKDAEGDAQDETELVLLKVSLKKQTSKTLYSANLAPGGSKTKPGALKKNLTAANAQLKAAKLQKCMRAKGSKSAFRIPYQGKVLLLSVKGKKLWLKRPGLPAQQLPKLSVFTNGKGDWARNTLKGVFYPANASSLMLVMERETKEAKAADDRYTREMYVRWLSLKPAPTTTATSTNVLKTTSRQVANQFVVLVSSKTSMAKIKAEQARFSKRGIETRIAAGDYLTNVKDGWYILVAGSFSSRKAAWSMVKKLKQKKIDCYPKYAGKFQARSAIAAKLCGRHPAPKTSKKRFIYFVQKKALWRMGFPKGTKQKIMPIKKTFDNILAGPLGRFIYASQDLKIYQVDLRSRKIKLYKGLKDQWNATCESLYIKRNRLICAAIGSGALKYKFAKSHKLRMTGVSHKPMYHNHSTSHHYIHKTKGSEFQVSYQVAGKKIQVYLRCGAENKALWGQLQIPKSHNKDHGKPAIHIPANGRVIMLFFPIMGGDTGTDGSLYALPRGKQAILMSAETQDLPVRWSSDHQWLLNEGKAYNFAHPPATVPQDAFWGK